MGVVKLGYRFRSDDKEFVVFKICDKPDTGLVLAYMAGHPRGYCLYFIAAMLEELAFLREQIDKAAELLLQGESLVDRAMVRAKTAEQQRDEALIKAAELKKDNERLYRCARAMFYPKQD